MRARTTEVPVRMPGLSPELAWLAAVTAAALLVRLAFVASFPLAPAWDGAIYARGGEDLARGLGYTRRMLDPSNAPVPTAFYPVGLPAMLALVARLGGGRLATLALESVLGAALVPSAWLFARRFFGRAAARTAALLAAAWPGGVLLAGSWLAEPLFTAGVGLAFVPLLVARRKRRLVALALSSLLLGVVAYVRITALAFVPFVAYGVALSRPREGSRARAHVRALGIAALATALALVPLLPWAARNARALGTPVLASTNGGVNLLIGTVGDGSFATPPAAIDCPSTLPEVERDRCRTAHALARIRRDPVGFLARGVLKVVHTLGHDSAPAQQFAAATTGDGRPTTTATTLALALCRGFWLPVIAFALVGLVRTLRSGSSLACALLVSPVAGFLALHFVTIGGDRYHAAITPMLFPLAARELRRSLARS